MIAMPDRRILIPKYKDLEMSVQGMGGRAQGRYKLVAVRPDGRERPLTGWFNNLITDVGLERLSTLNLNNNIARCYVGSGNNPPATTDTGLQTPVANSATWQSYTRGRVTIGSAPITAIYSKVNIIYRFAAGVAAGNLSEVGVGTTAVGSNLYSRALILDALGAPTTITVLSDEVLDVYYEHRLYYDLADYAFSVTVSGVVYNGIRRIYSSGGAVDNSWNPESEAYAVIRNVDVHNGALGSITSGGPGGSTGGADSTVASAYVPGSKSRRYTSSWGLNSGNVAGGITAMKFWHTPGWTQMSFAPAIPKDNTKTLVLVNDSAPWTRYVP